MKDSTIFKNAVSEKRLYSIVKEVSNYHRIQASPMFREAAEHVVQLCRKYGLDVKMLQYDAKADSWYLQQKMFKEWSCTEATLDLVQPEIRLADYSSEPVSVIQKSYPIDKRNEEVDLVLLDKGSNPDEYKDIDFKGKMVFGRTQVNTLNWVFDRGAVGVVTDFIMETQSRKRSDLYNSMTYTSFWHSHLEGETEKRGFVLSPKMGDQLAKMCREQFEKDGTYLKVKPYINSEIYDGHIQVVEVTIEGNDDRCVYLSAHLCHPRSSCNDNASGVSAAIETMNVINTLIKEGKLEKPQHTIKMTLIPEFTGTFCYLSDHTDYKNGLGAINLDMVGGKQTRFYGPITLTKTPLAAPALNNEICCWAMKQAAREAAAFSGDYVSLTNHSVSQFTGGSDHTVYSDPTINIPCCMLGQWPDLNYHTATDTIDVIDPAVLKFSTLTAVNFAWALANFKEEDLPFIFEELEENIISDKTKLVNEYLNRKIDKDIFGSMMVKYRKYFVECVRTASRLVEGFNADEQIRHIENMFADWMKHYDISDSYPVYSEYDTVYKREFVGPINAMKDYRNLGYGRQIDEYQEKTKGYDMFALMSVESLVVYYIDGKRTVNEIIREVSLEMRKDMKDLILVFMNTLEEINLVSKIQ